MSIINVTKKTLLDAVSLVSDQTSSVQNIDNIISFAVQFTWEGGTTINGTLTVEGSLDGENFVPVEQLALVNEDDGNYLVNIERAGYSYMRANYDFTSGTGGTLTVLFNSKRV